MATATLLPASKFPCTVTVGDGWIDVTSDRTKKTLRLENVLLQNYNPDQAELVDLLSQGGEGTRPMELTIGQMKMFKELTEGAALFDPQEKAAEQVYSGIARRTEAPVAIDDVGRRIAVLQQIVDVTNVNGYVMLVYDIPENKNDVVKNPSNILWWHGFRMNLSCWVLPTSRLDHYQIEQLMAHWRSHNIEFHVVEYSERSMARIRQIAQLKLDKEIRRTHTALIENIANADQALAEAMAELARQEAEGKEVTNDERLAEEVYRHNQVRTQLREAGKRLDAVISCAEVFDSTMEVNHLIQGLRDALKVRTEVFNIRMRELGRKEAPAVA